MSLKPASEYTGDVFDLYEEGTEAEMRVSIKGESIVIKEENAFDYEIPLSDCETVTGALRWVEHVRQKTWMTDVMLSRVIGLMIQHNEAR